MSCRKQEELNLFKLPRDFGFVTNGQTTFKINVIYKYIALIVIYFVKNIKMSNVNFKVVEN